MPDFDSITDIIAALNQGKPVIITDDEQRENEADIVVAADACTPDIVNFMIRCGRGLVCVALTQQRVTELSLPMMPARGRDPFSTAFTVSIDARSTTTGISAAERAHTIRLAADPSSQPDDFITPGHVFPLRARTHGVLSRPGHTEAAVDLASLAGHQPAGAICEVIARDGTMLRPGGAQRFARRYGLRIGTVRQLQIHRLQTETIVVEDATATLPTAYGDFTLHSFIDTTTSQCHVALVCRRYPERPPLIRVHSQCLTGDVFGSLRCDCGSQLRTALQVISDRGCGALLYIHQEGRGIGLQNKIRAYQLQDKGLDTVDANIAQGLPIDARDYAVAAHILRCLGFDNITLLTANPDKQQQLATYGINIINTQPIQAAVTHHNRRYLTTKKHRLHHNLKEV